MQDREKEATFDLKAAWRILFRILRVVIPVVLLYFLFRNLDWQQIQRILTGYPYGFLLLAFGINLFANFIFAVRWYYLIRSIKIEFPFWTAVRLVYYGLFLSNFLPTTIGGDLVKVVGILQGKENQNRSLRISTVVADRVFSLSSKILILPFVLWLFPQGLKPAFDLPFLHSSLFVTLFPKGLTEKLQRYWSAVKPWFKFRSIAIVYLLSYISLFFTILSYWVVIQAFQPAVPLVEDFLHYTLDLFCHNPACIDQRNRDSGRELFPFVNANWFYV